MTVMAKQSMGGFRRRFFWKQRPVLFLLVLSSAMAGAQDTQLSAPMLALKAPSRIDSGVSSLPALQDSPSSSHPLPILTPSSPIAISPKQKLWYATENAFGIPSAIFAAAGAGANQAQNLYPEFHQGAEGYGRYFWHSYTDQAVDSYFVNFLLPTTMHTDPRYRPLRFGGIGARMKYLGANLLWTHTDTGKLTFNASQVLGSGMAASISSLYYPERDRTAPFVTQRWASNLAGDELLMVLKEFAPELVRAGKHACSSIWFGVFICKDDKPTDYP